MSEGTSLLDFETLYDHDFDDHLYQEEANKRDFDDSYQARDYYALRFSRWARLIIGDQFYYATLYSLASYLTDRLEDMAHELIPTLIPHQYVEGSEHGKREKGGFLWDMRVDANGQEKQLEELNRRWHPYLQQRWLELSQRFVDTPPAVYMQDIEEPGECHRNFIFNNEAALKQVRWCSFMADCQRLQADNAEVTNLERQEKAKADAWLRATHKDIVENFDPRVVKLTRKRKIVIAPGALDGLVDGDNGETDDSSE